AHLLDELPERRSLRPDGIDHDVLAACGVSDCQLRKVPYVDAADAIVTAAADGEQRQAAQEPCDVVHQHAAVAEQDCGSQHGIRHARLGQRPFDERLPTEI